MTDGLRSFLDASSAPKSVSAEDQDAIFAGGQSEDARIAGRL
jgi:hypothetical protein